MPNTVSHNTDPLAVVKARGLLGLTLLLPFFGALLGAVSR